MLALDKARFPRYKCCGGGITVRAARLAGIDVAGMAEDVIDGAVITFKGSHSFSGVSQSPIMYTIRRETFDKALVDRARTAGAEVVEGVEVLDVKQDTDGVDIITGGGTYRGRFAAGADGARGRAGRAMGRNNHDAAALCKTARICVSPEKLAAWRTKIGLDFGRVAGGYGWVFPKGDHLSVGIACPSERGRELKQAYGEYLGSLDLGPYDVVRQDVELLPVMAGHPELVRGRVLLLGDAAGLADPLTGEGIYNALLSAKMSAKALEKALREGPAALNDYSKDVGGTIVPEMKSALVFGRILTALPGRLLDLVKEDKRVWDACCRLMRGEMDYTTIRKRISSLGGLYRLITHRG